MAGKRSTASSGIARRLGSINLIASGTALGVACLTLMVYDFVTVRSTILSNRTVQAEIIASNTSGALTFDDRSDAERTLAALRAAPHIEAAGLYRADGSLFATYFRDSDGGALALPDAAPNQADWYRYDGLESLHLTRRVVSEGSPIGVVYLKSDMGEVTSRLTGYTLIVGGVMLLAIVTSHLIGRVATRSISSPLAELASVATQLTANRDYSVRATLRGSDEIGVLIGTFNEMVEEIQRRDRSLQESHDHMERRVLERTEALNESNKELEAFCYSVSHDLRSPLRSIDGFSQALLEDLDGQLDAMSTDHLHRIRAATQRMGALIDDLLNLSRVSRSELVRKQVDLSAISRSIVEEHRVSSPQRQVTITIADDMLTGGDPRLLRQVLENLLGNAWKFTSNKPDARIEFGVMDKDGETVYFVADNGAGFDPAFADRLFGVFQRLHGMTEFPGTGVGLAIVDRIVRRHGGRVWADSAVDRGATFYFSLGATVPRAKAA